MAKRNRWEYLNDYRKNEAGRYEYQGKYFVYAGSPEDKKRDDLCFWTFLLIAAASCIASGCISGAGITNTFYVIIPFLLEVCSLFVLAWNHVRLFTQKNEIKAYIFRSAHPKLPVAAVLMAFFALAGFLLSLGFSVTTGFRDGVPKAVLYLLLKLCTAAAALLYRNRMLKTAWTEV